MSHQEIIDVISTVIWPFAAVIISIAAMLIFRKPFSNLIGRVKSLDRNTGLTFGEASDQIAKKDETFVQTTQSLSADPERESVLVELNGKEFQNDSDKVWYLADQVALYKRMAHFELIDSRIWGSQINLLSLVNQRIDGFDMGEVGRYYETIVAAEAPFFNGYPLNEYLRFLSSWGLVEYVANKLRITERGKGFLYFLVTMGRPLHRPR